MTEFPNPLAADVGDLEAALHDAFTSHRKAEVDRGVTLVGPHRDEWRLLVGGMEPPPPTHTPPEQASLLVQALPSSQTAPLATFVNTHPVAGLQLSVVHTLWSLQ